MAARALSNVSLFISVTTKEIPKRELREIVERADNSSGSPETVTTKEIPKRELRGDSLCRWGQRREGPALRYNKRNPKKGIESFLARSHAKSLRCSASYNKRNPKKGIESSPPFETARPASQSVTTKEIPKRELRSDEK